jgi:hypothetical protein
VLFSVPQKGVFAVIIKQNAVIGYYIGKHYHYEKENSKFYNAGSYMRRIRQRLCCRAHGRATASATTTSASGSAVEVEAQRPHVISNEVRKLKRHA